MPYAEVIGDPIAQSKSPVIHNYWLEQRKIAGDYWRTRVTADELPSYLDQRRSDRCWRGCNVTIPHKEKIMGLLDRLESGAEAIGAVNCVVPQEGALVGYNTDIDGVGAALDHCDLRGRKVAIIGAGGGARAVIAYLANRSVGHIALLVRNPDRVSALAALARGSAFDVLPFDRADAAFQDAAAIVNASPLGMAGAQPMPQSLLEAVTRKANAATIFDLVTTPAQTEFLAAGRSGGGHGIDGLKMLVGQAARAFELFFGAAAPSSDQALRHLLTTERRDSA